MNRLVLYAAHPLAPTPEQIRAAMAGEPDDHERAARVALRRNLESAMRWLSWLRRSFPEATFIAPWIAAVLSGEDDANPRQREAGLVDADAVVPICSGIVLCGGRISSGMARERKVARRAFDLLWLGADPPTEQLPAGIDFAMWTDLRGLLSGIAAPAVQPQPAPIANDSLPIIHLVLSDLYMHGDADRAGTSLLVDALRARSRKGLETYGVALQAHNGRDALQDAADEADDAVMYLRQDIAEHGHSAERDADYAAAISLAIRLHEHIARRGQSAEGTKP